MGPVKGVLDVATMRRLSELTCPFELQLFKEQCIDPDTIMIDGAQLISVDTVEGGFIVRMKVDDTPKNRDALVRWSGNDEHR